MKLSVIKKLSVDLVPEDARQWVSALVQPLNGFLDQVTRALTNQLTISDNLKSFKTALIVEGTQAYPLKIAYPLNEKPSLVLLGQIQTQDGSAVSAHTFTWKLNNGVLEVTIAGLSAVKHSITIVALV